MLAESDLKVEKIKLDGKIKEKESELNMIKKKN